MRIPSDHQSKGRLQQRDHSCHHQPRGGRLARAACEPFLLTWTPVPARSAGIPENRIDLDIGDVLVL